MAEIKLHVFRVEHGDTSTFRHLTRVYLDANLTVVAKPTHFVSFLIPGAPSDEARREEGIVHLRKPKPLPTHRELVKKIRKPIPKPTQSHPPKKGKGSYRRKPKSVQ